MAERPEIKTKTFFQIPPKTNKGTLDEPLYYPTRDRVVFMDTGFDLNSIVKVSEVYEVRALHYVFFVHLGYSDDLKLEFEFKRKGDALMAQRELTRAWTRTGEFAYEDLEVGEG